MMALLIPRLKKTEQKTCIHLYKSIMCHNKNIFLKEKKSERDDDVEAFLASFSFFANCKGE